jgi:hypothetical protein
LKTTESFLIVFAGAAFSATFICVRAANAPFALQLCYDNVRHRGTDNNRAGNNCYNISAAHYTLADSLSVFSARLLAVEALERASHVTINARRITTHQPRMTVHTLPKSAPENRVPKK